MSVWGTFGLFWNDGQQRHGHRATRVDGNEMDLLFIQIFAGNMILRRAGGYCVVEQRRQLHRQGAGQSLDSPLDTGALPAILLVQ